MALEATVLIHSAILPPEINLKCSELYFAQLFLKNQFIFYYIGDDFQGANKDYVKDTKASAHNQVLLSSGLNVVSQASFWPVLTHKCLRKSPLPRETSGCAGPWASIFHMVYINSLIKIKNYKTHGLMCGIVIYRGQHRQMVGEEGLSDLFIVSPVYVKTLGGVLGPSHPVQVQEPSLHALSCQMHHSWLISSPSS